MAHLNRTTRISGALAAAALVATACAGAVEAPSSTAPEAAPPQAWMQTGGPLMVSRMSTLGDSAVGLALEAGWFAEAGLDVEIVETQRGSELVPSLIAGDLDISYQAIQPALLRAMADGVDLRIIAAANTYRRHSCEDRALVATPEAAARLRSGDPALVKGLTIGATSRSLTGRRYLATLLDTLGVEDTDVTLTEVDWASAVAVLRRGDVDAIVLVEPLLGRARETLDVEALFPVGELQPGSLHTAVFASRRVLEDRELGARFLAVYLRGQARYSEGPTPRNVELLSGPSGIEPDLLRSMCWTTLDADGRHYVPDLRSLQEFGVETGDLDRVLPDELVWDHGLYLRALELLAEWGLDDVVAAVR